MKYLTLNKLVLVLCTAISVTALSACSNTNAPYRTYRLDAACRYVYVDQHGDVVHDGKYVDARFMGLPMKKDCNGRWYYEDSFGNKIYKSKRCE